MTRGPTLSVDEVAARVDAIRRRIEAAGADPAQVRLVAVTKGFGVDVVRAALGAGLVDIGESYAQELLAKAAELESADAAELEAAEAEARPMWHFVGRLQRNKVRKLAPQVSVWQSVDRLALGAEIARHAPGAKVLAQVDLSDEPSKGGCPPTLLPALLDGLADLGLEVQGLMGIGPLGPPEDARAGFRELRRLADRHGLLERSMGMSDDLEVAVEEGATMVRVGSGLFGPRPGRTRVEH
jgi:pyridoxal phosphate enzyme (YggS family)